MTEPRSAGFTLLEVMIGLALLGTFTILCYSAVRLESISWLHAAERRDADADRTAIYALLSQSLANAYPDFASPKLTDSDITFNGDSTKLQLVAPLPQTLSQGIMAVERFELGSGDDRSSLLMVWRLNLPSSAGGLLPERFARIADSVASIRFEYFGRIDRFHPPAWFDRWQGMDRLPELVRVQVWRNGGTQSPWLDFSTQPKVTTNVSCVYDMMDAICQRVE